MKKRFFVILLGCIVLATACSTEKKAPEKESVKAPDTLENAEGTHAEAAANTNSNENEEIDEVIIEEDEQLKIITTYTNDDLDLQGSTGTFIYNVTAIELKENLIKSQKTANKFRAEIGDKVHTVTVYLGGENTSDEHFIYPIAGSIITTNTDERLEPDPVLSDPVLGYHRGKENHSGSTVYKLKESTVQELKAINLYMPPPYRASDRKRAGDSTVLLIHVND